MSGLKLKENQLNEHKPFNPKPLNSTVAITYCQKNVYNHINKQQLIN